MPMTESRGTSPGKDSLDVLVVDDEPEVAWSTAEVLRVEGLKVAIAPTIEAGLQVIDTREVRSVILDHHLAGDDGERFLTMRRHIPPVIVMTGIGRDALADLQATHGERLFACLAKPVPPVKLIEVVKAAMMG